MSIDVAAPLGEARLLLVLQLLAEGRTELAEMQVRGTVTLEADLLRRVIDRIANPIESPGHECCGCSDDEEPDWGECPNCMDGHCPGCTHIENVLEEAKPTSDETIALVKELRRSVRKCYGGLSE